MGRGDDYVSPSGSHLLRWKCKCECGNTINATTSQLKRGLSSCGCVSKREDLTNRRFGKLTVLYSVDDYVSPKGAHISKWHCKCDCGNEKDVLSSSLKNGDTQSCGRCEKKKRPAQIIVDYSGQQFGDLYVINRIDGSHPPKYICRCSCGREVTVLQKDLSSGKKTHCGCKTVRKKLVSPKRPPHNYIGERIGTLTVLEELEPHMTPNGSKQRIIKCLCDCGNIFTVRLTSALNTQKCRDCSNKDRRVDITGKRFGRLVVLSMANDYVSPEGHRLARCRCLCDCGNTLIVNMSGLITGKTRSCGCLQNSAGLLKDNPDLVAKYDFTKNNELGIDFKTITARSSKRIWWKCSVCKNSWFATVGSQNDRIKHGCPYCSGRLVIKGKTDLLTLFPDVTKEWNYEKNGELQPQDVSAQSSKKVWWKCSEGHEWKATVSNRTGNKSGCPRCNIENVNSFCEQAVFFYVKKAFSDAVNGDDHLGIELDIFIPSKMAAIEYDGEAWHNNKRRQQNDAKKNAICERAGITLIRIREPRLPDIDNCLTIRRESSTANKSLDDAIRSTLSLLGIDAIEVNTDLDTGYILEQFATKKHQNSLAFCCPDVASEWHPTKNGSLTPDKVSKSSRRKVWWLGKCGHEWQMTIGDRTRTNGRPQGCPYCAGKRILIGYNDLESQYPEIASELHPTKNLGLKPTEIMPGSSKIVWWLGKCGHEWQSTPNQRCHTNDQCPICFREKRSPAVVCIETGKEFHSGIEAAISLGHKSASSIYKCCRGETKSAFGYKWAFPKPSDNEKDNTL